ncbi:MAG: Rpn family recombination-promoting nuclease/putative transposase [Clostridiales bacterium]|nr:Rpn family recombination-promoting nuclease/putative transposase [Clostridiales bacterium]
MNTANREYIEGHLVVLVEHQSTVNKNMPLRMLSFINEIYRGFLPERAVYDKELKPLPTPEFFVIYNGSERREEKEVLRLSDAFICKKGEPSLELVVPVYSIANGQGKELLGHSTALSHYAFFVSRVNDNRNKGATPEEALDEAIHHCIENGIMREYLTVNNAEVRRMLSYEWNEEIYREVLIEEGERKGREEGLLKVAQNMKAEGAEPAFIAKVTGLSEEAIRSSG